MAAHNPIPVLVFIAASRLLVGTVTATNPELVELEPCEDVLDVLTGCGGTIGAIIGSALGIIPGAHPSFNTLLALITNATLVWAIMTWARGN